MSNMWSKCPQREIGRTESGKPIGFHFDPNSDLDQRDHFEAALYHDRLRNMAAIEASRLDKAGYKGAAHGYRELAKHHVEQSKLHSGHMNMDVKGERARYPGARYQKPEEIGRMGRGNARLTKDRPMAGRGKPSKWRVFMTD